MIGPVGVGVAEVDVVVETEETDDVVLMEEADDVVLMVEMLVELVFETVVEVDTTIVAF